MFPIPPGTFYTPNLTPDPKTGRIAAWDEETFVTRFRGGKAFAGSHMPWEHFAPGIPQIQEATGDGFAELVRRMPELAKDIANDHPRP